MFLGSKLNFTVSSENEIYWLKGVPPDKPVCGYTGELCIESKTEPQHDKTNTIICAPSEDSDQPGHTPSLIRVFAVIGFLAIPRANSKDCDQTERMIRLSECPG